MKRFQLIILTALVVLLSLNGYSQRVDIDKVKFSVERSFLPSEPLEEDIFFYEATIDNAPSIKEIVTDEKILAAINISGMKQAYNQEKPFLIKVYTNNFKIDSPSLGTRIEETKDKNGKVTGRTKYYKINAAYSFGAGYESYKPDGSVLTERIATDQSLVIQHYSTKEYSTSKAASEFWNNNKTTIKSEIIQSHVNKLTADISNKLSSLVGYRISNNNDVLWTMDSKKHPENLNFQKHTQLFIDEFNTLTAIYKEEGHNERLKTSIDYFTKLSKGNTDDKHSRRIVFASITNLAMFYYFMDEPLIAKEWAQKLIDQDINKRDGEDLIERSDWLFNLFETNGKFTSHFERIIPEVSEENLKPNITAKTEEIIIEEPEEPKYIEGIVITDEDKEVEGYFINDFTNEPWEVQDGVRFISKADFNNGDYSKKAVEKYSPKELKGLGFEDKVFLPILYSDVSKLSDNPLSSTAKLRFLEVKIDGKYKLLNFHEEPASFQTFSGSLPEDPDPNEMDLYQLIQEPDEKKATRATTKNIEDILEKHPSVNSRYLKGEFNKDGEPVETKRSVLDRLDAKLSMDDNLNLESLIKALNE